MKFFLIIAISIIIVTVQVAIFPHFDIFGARLNLLLSICVAWAICEKEKKISWYILIFALLLDLLVGEPFGLITLSIWLVFIFIKWLGSFLFRQSGFVSVAALSIIGISFYKLIYFVFYKLAGIIKIEELRLSWSDFYPSLPIFVLLNSLLCIFALWIFRRNKSFIDEIF